MVSRTSSQILGNNRAQWASYADAERRNENTSVDMDTSVPTSTRASRANNLKRKRSPFAPQKTICSTSPKSMSHLQSPPSVHQGLTSVSTINSDEATALLSLDPGRELTSTALQRLFDIFKQPIYHILDPSFASESWNIRTLKKLDPHIKTLLIPLHHSKARHWTLACYNVKEATIYHYDSLPSLGALPASVSRITGYATTIFSSDSREWKVRVPTFSMQTTDVDCGVFAVLAAIYIMSDLPPPTNLSNCNAWRFVFRAVLQNNVAEGELEFLFPVHKSAARVALESLDPINLSEFVRNASVARMKDQTYIESLQATVQSLASIHQAWSKVNRKIEGSTTATQRQLKVTQSDQSCYDYIFATLTQLQSSQPNTDSLRDHSSKNYAVCVLRNPYWRDFPRLRSTTVDVGLQAIAMTMGFRW